MLTDLEGPESDLWQTVCITRVGNTGFQPQPSLCVLFQVVSARVSLRVLQSYGSQIAQAGSFELCCLPRAGYLGEAISETKGAVDMAKVCALGWPG